WMVQDGLGSVRGVADASGTTLWSGSYGPYGNDFGDVGVSQTPYGFTGEPTNATGLVHLRARDYNPALGIFTALDPFEGMAQRPMSLNGYSWVEGNVANAVDASGKFAQMIIGAIGSSLHLSNIMNSGMCYQQPSPPCSGAITFSECFRICMIDALIPDEIERSAFCNNVCGNCNRTSPTPTPTVGQARLPLDGAILTPYGCNWINSNGSPLRSRDVNPRECDTSGNCRAVAGAPNPVFAPVPEAEVMIVDEDAGALGRFVAIRVDTQYLPGLSLGDGYLYIAYSHLSQINVSAGDGGEPYPIVGDRPLGISGQSGTDSVHLDLMMFFTSTDSDLIVPRQVQAGDETNLHQNFQSFFRLSGIGNYGNYVTVQEVDPLSLWPEMNIPSVCG
ncbi:MAG: RHS repeat-associated core domain-containing protein, partial [Anaerolineae bacterium]|nr:RHS repeat-associated core domain-containing protein [Anaerolineae bacterium]